VRHRLKIGAEMDRAFIDQNFHFFWFYAHHSVQVSIKHLGFSGAHTYQNTPNLQARRRPYIHPHAVHHRAVELATPVG
jgi:hypothetical protein